MSTCETGECKRYMRKSELIAPSMLAADFLNLEKSIEIVNRYADIFHMDVMDGVFVPNISFGFPVIEAVSSRAAKPLDVHLMISEPSRYALKFAAIDKVGMVSFHLEACPEPAGLLESIRKSGVKAGLVINPDIPVERLFPFLEHCDFILLMSVFAGFGGQKFIGETFERVSVLRKEIAARGLDVKIEVDGGVGPSNARALADAGADILVAGTAVFNADNPEAVINSMK